MSWKLVNEQTLFVYISPGVQSAMSMRSFRRVGVHQFSVTPSNVATTCSRWKLHTSASTEYLYQLLEDSTMSITATLAADGLDQNGTTVHCPSSMYLCVPCIGPVAVCGAWWWCVLECPSMSWQWFKSLLQNPPQGCIVYICWYVGYELTCCTCTKGIAHHLSTVWQARNCSYRTADDEKPLICLPACQTIVMDGCHFKCFPWQTAGLSISWLDTQARCPWSTLCHLWMSSLFGLQCRLHCTCLFQGTGCTVVLDCFLAHAVVPVVYLRGCWAIVVLCDAFLLLISMGWWFTVHCAWLMHIIHWPCMDWWCQRGVSWGYGERNSRLDYVGRV